MKETQRYHSILVVGVTVVTNQPSSIIFLNRSEIKGWRIFKTLRKCWEKHSKLLDVTLAEKQGQRKAINHQAANYNTQVNTKQSGFSPKLFSKRLALYWVEKCLTDSNCLVRKGGTNYTQTACRIRKVPFKPHYQNKTINFWPGKQ